MDAPRPVTVGSWWFDPETCLAYVVTYEFNDRYTLLCQQDDRYRSRVVRSLDGYEKLQTPKAGQFWVDQLNLVYRVVAVSSGGVTFEPVDCNRFCRHLKPWHSWMNSFRPFTSWDML